MTTCSRFLSGTSLYLAGGNHNVVLDLGSTNLRNADCYELIAEHPWVVEHCPTKPPGGCAAGKRSPQPTQYESPATTVSASPPTASPTASPAHTTPTCSPTPSRSSTAVLEICTETSSTLISDSCFDSLASRPSPNNGGSPHKMSTPQASPPRVLPLRSQRSIPKPKTLGSGPLQPKLSLDRSLSVDESTAQQCFSGASETRERPVGHMQIHRRSLSLSEEDIYSRTMGLDCGAKRGVPDIWGPGPSQEDRKASPAMLPNTTGFLGPSSGQESAPLVCVLHSEVSLSSGLHELSAADVRDTTSQHLQAKLHNLRSSERGANERDDASVPPLTFQSVQSGAKQVGVSDSVASSLLGSLGRRRFGSNGSSRIIPLKPTYASDLNSGNVANSGNHCGARSPPVSTPGSLPPVAV